MRAIWKGSINFGLVAIPVGLAAATESRSISFRQICRKDHARIRHERICTAEDRPVPWHDVGRGWELPDGRMLAIEDTELAALPLPSAHTIDVTEFVPTSAVDPILFDRSYYLEPQPVGLRAYTLLRTTMEKLDCLGVAKLAIRSRERVAALRTYGQVLSLTTLLWPDELRQPDFAFLTSGEAPAVREQEQAMAEQLVSSMTSETFDASDYRDAYREALEKLIDAKLTGTELAPSSEAPVEAPIDLEQALRASLDEARRD